MQTISATELATNTRKILDRIVSQQQSVVIERNRTMIAQITPPQKTMTAAQALVGLTSPVLTEAQGAAWLKDSRSGFGDAVLDPWA